MLHSPANPMQCTLHIPYLLPPREWGDSVWQTVHAPHLKTLLARAQYGRSSGMDDCALLCEAFGIARQHDSPLAPLLARKAGLPAENGYWLCATPVHLETRRNALLLIGPAALDISAAESAALAATLAQHLGGDNISLHAPQPQQWFVCSATPPAMTTTSLDTVIGRDVRDFLPQGPDSRRWHRILTEMQMLLHAHAVNEAREAEGRTPINSVWLWAGGALPAPAAAPFAAVWSDDDAVHALAGHAGCRIAAAPARITPDTLDQGTHFFSTRLLVAPLRQGDLPAWSAAVAALDRDWFQPLLQGLRTRRVNRVHLISNHDAGAHRFTIHSYDLWKFWRKNKYLQ
jgi:hypothetical protein